MPEASESSDALAAAIAGAASPASAPRRVLVADDQHDVLLALRLLLKSNGLEVETVDSPAAVLAALARGRHDLLLMDLNYTRDTTSGAEGLELLPRIQALDRDLPVLVMTAWGTLQLAVEAMKRGARDFVLKPWDNAALLQSVREHLERRRPEPTGPQVSFGEYDLRVATRVQARLLPDAASSRDSLDFAGRCVQAGAVGGDAYDVFAIGEAGIALVLADASGKGVSGALLMAHLLGSLRGESERGGDLSQCLRAVNRRYYASTAPEHYATLFFGCYDGATALLRYANCGHNPPLLLRGGGGNRRLLPTAPAIGLLDDWRARVEEIQLFPGDVLVAFSDGITEARDEAGEEFGDERLADVAERNRTASAAEIADRVLEATGAFAGARRDDDRTVLVARVREA